MGRYSFHSAILIRVAEIAYARRPSFEVDAPGQPTMVRRIAWAMLNRPVYREAFDSEGIDVDWDELHRLAGEQASSGPASPSVTTAVTETRSRRDGAGWRSWIPGRNATRGKL